MAERPRGSCVEMYRVDVSGVSWPILVVAGLCTMVGVCGIGAAFVTHGYLSQSRLIPLAGSACMLAGPLMAVVGMRALILQDEYVAALEGGLLMQLDKQETYLAWGAIDRVTWSAEKGAMMVTLAEGDPIVIEKKFSRSTPQEMAARIDDVRRKAVFTGAA